MRRPGPWLAIAVVLGIAVRAVLLPAPGYVDDLTEFAGWIRHIANDGLTHAYDANLSFGPVMAYMWGLLAVLDPAFRTATDGSDVWVRIAMKLPAVLADFGLAATVWLALRSRPGWAAVGAAVILLHPAIWFISAWWGQYESIFALLVVVAYVLAVRNRSVLAVVALTAALLTKPQVAPLMVPFAAWFVVRSGLFGAAGSRSAAIAGLARLAVVAAITAVVLWLPFLAADGPAKYLAALGTYQSAVYSVLSLNAWNLWWLFQQLLVDGALVGDNQAFIGPVTFRVVGYVLAGFLLLIVAAGVWRRPTAEGLALGIATAALVAFAFLTTMHERYAYAAVVFLALLVEHRRVRWIALVLGIVFFLNLVASATVHDPAPLVAMGGINGLVGSLAVIGVTLALLLELLSVGGTPSDTSAGSAGATSGA